MSTISEIPLSPIAQTFAIALSGVTYQLAFKWCPPAACWMMDIADENDVPLAAGIPLVTGADLLAQFGYLGILGRLIVQTDFDPDAVPTKSNLGTLGHLYYVTS